MNILTNMILLIGIMVLSWYLITLVLVRMMGGQKYQISKEKRKEITAFILSEDIVKRPYSEQIALVTNRFGLQGKHILEEIRTGIFE